MNNTDMDATFVYNNARVIYNALPLFSGSPFHRTNSTAGPAGPLRVDYEMNFPDDDPLLGATDFVLNNPGNPDQYTISDQSAVAEQTVYRIFEGLGLVNNHRRLIHFFVNGSQRSKAYERAAASLGASPARVFRRVTLPLSMPGIAAGSLIVFAWTLSAFPTPELLGGGRVKMIANVVKDLGLDSFNWPGAAAFAMLALALTLALLALVGRFTTERAS